MEIPVLAQAVAVIIGLVNGVRLAFDTTDKYRKGLIFFGVALVVGLLFGALGWFGLTPESGIVAALASSGLYRLTQIV